MLVGAGLEIDLEAKLLRGRLLAALGDGLAAGHVHGYGFGQIDVLAGLDGGGRLLRMKIRRAFDDDRVELLLQQPAIAGEPGEAAGGRHVELRSGLVGVVLEVIRDGDDVIAAVLLEQVGHPFPAVAAADEADVDLRVGLGAADQLRLQDGEGEDGGAGSGDEMPAGHR